MIHTEHLTRTFARKEGGPLTAVDDLSLDVGRGEVFGFLGPNGAGKTTTIRLLACLIRPSSGSAVVNGYTVGRESTGIRRSVGLLTETPGMYDRLSASQNLSFFGGFYGSEDLEGQVEKYLRLLGLWERREDEVGSFSKGMRQKLALARALLHEPALLFLDEPTAGLDPEAAALVRDAIDGLRGQGRTIFLCTHNLDEAERLCDRVAVFKTRLLVVDTPANLRRRIFGRQVVYHLRALPPALPAQIAALPDVQSAEAIDNRLLVRLGDPDRTNPDIIRALVAAGADVQFVGELRHSLEDVYLQLMRQGG
ncbi:MAG: ABC transporter ATP-binding protein [Caldilineales bacterium]|nr:ABC transporter ATP-binding protein [Caldilineales bacterium]